MQDKLRNFWSKEHFLAFAGMFRDVRFNGLLLFLVITLLVTWSSVRVIQTNYHLQKEITALKQRNDLSKLRNENLKLKNTYYTTEQYLELAARENFGLAFSGEKLVIIPESVAMAQTIEIQPAKTTAEIELEKKPFYQQNIEDWFNFFLNRDAEN